MISALEHLRKEVRLLSPGEREAFLTVLERDILEDSGAAEEMEAAWEEEISRRVREIESGEAELIPHEQVMAELRAHLAAKRQALCSIHRPCKSAMAVNWGPVPGRQRGRIGPKEDAPSNQRLR